MHKVRTSTTVYALQLSQMVLERAEDARARGIQGTAIFDHIKECPELISQVRLLIIREKMPNRTVTAVLTHSLLQKSDPDIACYVIAYLYLCCISTDARRIHQWSTRSVRWMMEGNDQVKDHMDLLLRPCRQRSAYFSRCVGLIDTIFEAYRYDITGHLNFYF